MNATAAPLNFENVSESRRTPLPMRIPQLDGLRGIAVLLVVLYHYLLLVRFAPGGFWSRIQDSVRLGWCGVDLFFVLSGFLIGGILLDARESPQYFRAFYLRRFYRILPLYYGWLGLYLVLALGALAHLPAQIATAWPGWKPAVVYALFLQNVVPKELRGISASWLGPLWSLAVEEQFYLVIPLAIRFLTRKRIVQLLIATILLAPLVRLIVYAWIPSQTARYVATPCRADALAMGVLLAVAMRDERWKARLAKNLRYLYPIAIALFGGVVYLGGWAPAIDGRAEALWGFSCIDAFFALVVLIVLARPQGWCSSLCRKTALRKIGGVSYCIYVVHLAVVELCRAAVNSRYKTAPVIADIIAVLIAAAVTGIVAKLSWRFLESPMVRRGHAHKY